MAGMLEALVDIFTSIRSLFEAWFTVAVVQRAHLVYLAVVVGSTAKLAMSMDTKLSCRALTVSSTRRHTEVPYTSFTNDAAATRRSTAVLEARQPARTVASTPTSACQYGPSTTDLWCRITDKSIGTRAVRFVVPHRADSVRSAQTFYEARVLTTDLAAGLLRGAVGVRAAPDLAVAIRQAGFFEWTVIVRVAHVNAARSDALLADGTVTLATARQSALGIDADVAGGAVRVVKAAERFADTSSCWFSTEMAQALAECAMFVVGATLGVRSAGEVVAWILAHRCTFVVWEAG